MIWVNSVTHALYTIIASDSTIVSSGISVDLNSIYNTDPNRCPWIGVYFGDMEIVPGRIGSATPWNAPYTLAVYVQGMSYQDGQDANDQLDRVMTPVLTAINSNRTLSGTVHMISRMSITPFQRDITDDGVIYANEILITAENQS